MVEGTVLTEFEGESRGSGSGSESRSEEDEEESSSSSLEDSLPEEPSLEHLGDLLVLWRRERERERVGVVFSF